MSWLSFPKKKTPRIMGSLSLTRILVAGAFSARTSAVSVKFLENGVSVPLGHFSAHSQSFNQVLAALPHLCVYTKSKRVRHRTKMILS